MRISDWSSDVCSSDLLLRYSYHVAGAVGVAMALVMGVDPRDETTLDRASDLGIAFQLANIARDVAEDAAADRCYLPVEWMVERSEEHTSELQSLMRISYAVFCLKKQTQKHTTT